MTGIQKRGRIVSFRVSEEEYQLLLEQSEKQGAHSVSEFARTLAFLSQSRNSPVTEVKALAQIHDLRERFEELSKQVADLRRRLDLELQVTAAAAS